MADLLCRVCLEPWDEYGVYHGDMTRWEYELFRKGAGCPCCEGERPEGLTDEQAFDEWGRQMVMDGPEDPDAFLTEVFVESAGVDYKRPKWERPEPKVKGGPCAGCGVRVVEDPERPVVLDDPAVFYWDGGERVHGWRGALTRWGEHPQNKDPAGDKRDWIEVEGKPYCPGCAQWCDSCSRNPVFTRSELCDDSYAPGASIGDPMSHERLICIPCYEEIPQCSECSQHMDSIDLDEDGLCENCRPEED